MTAENDLNLNDKIIFDPKRRRIETDLQGDAIDQESILADGLDINNGPKNVIMAGPGPQARQTL